MLYRITYTEQYTVIDKVTSIVEADSKEEALDRLNKGYEEIEDVDGISDNTEMLEILNIEETE